MQKFLFQSWKPASCQPRFSSPDIYEYWVPTVTNPLTNQNIHQTVASKRQERQYRFAHLLLPDQPIPAIVWNQRKNGYRTTILEMGTNSGGQLTAWQRQGYTFDFCLQWLVGSDHGIYHDLFREIGAIQSDTEVIHHDVFLKMVDENYGDFSYTET
jgi:NAD(P)-binding Rossmann-like domain